MKKAIIIGCPGSGKTTFSGALFAKVNIPLYHLDSIWHKPDKTHISRGDFDARLGEILALESWIIDGNYSRTLEHRLAECDTVFLFDLPTEICITGAASRVGKKREDLPWIDTELDGRLLEEIKSFREEKLPEIYALLSKHRKDKQIVIFKSREAADEYLRALECEKL